MFRDKMNLLGGQFQGLNMNPISLEFSQEMTTTKWLMALLAKIDEVIGFTNNWYDEILTDLENDGVLYEKLINEFMATFSADITALQNNVTSLNNLLAILQYTKPSIELTTSPNNYLYAVGDTVNSVMLNFNVTKGSNNIIKAEIYKNDVLLTTINTVQNGMNNFVDGNAINSDTSYCVKIYDDKGSVISNKIQFTFVYKAWYGKIANDGIVSESFINTLNSVDFQNSFDFTVSLNDEKIIIVSHDLISSVVDSENYDMIDSFTLSTINININNVVTPYNVYVSTYPILDTNVKIIIEK